MRHLPAMLILALGAVFVAGLQVAGRSVKSVEPKQAAAATPPAPAEIISAQLPSRQAVDLPPVNARPIAKSLIAQPETGGALERIAPRPSLSPPPKKPAAPAAEDSTKWRLRLLHQPVAASAGEIEAGGYRIVLRGIVPTDLQKLCTTPDGGTWPCGLRARTEFRAFLRARSIRCKVPVEAPGTPIRTECSLAGEDVSAWLLKNGWAQPETGAVLAAGLGLNGSGQP